MLAVDPPHKPDEYQVGSFTLVDHDKIAVLDPKSGSYVCKQLHARQLEHYILPLTEALNCFRENPVPWDVHCTAVHVTDGTVTLAFIHVYNAMLCSISNLGIFAVEFIWGWSK